MSDGSGGAPQLDERTLDAARAIMALDIGPESQRPEFSSSFQDWNDHYENLARAALAASPGAGELDLTDDEEIDLKFCPLHGFTEQVGVYCNRPMGTRMSCGKPLRVETVPVAKLRARLDRKDDDG